MKKMKKTETGQSVELDLFGLRKFRMSVSAAVALVIVLVVVTLLVGSTVVGLWLCVMVGGQVGLLECVGFAAIAIMTVGCSMMLHFPRE